METNFHSMVRNGDIVTGKIDIEIGSSSIAICNSCGRQFAYMKIPGFIEEFHYCGQLDCGEAHETSEWIEERNRKLGVKPEAHQIGISPWFDRAADGTVESLPFEPPTQDTKAMMDPFYDMWVAGVK